MTEQREIADAYADPRIYDILHTPDTRAELDALERIVARFFRAKSRAAVRRLRWLEPCCGTGRFLRLMARRGERVVGVELDPAVADYANAYLPQRGTARARAIIGDIRTLDALAYPRGLGPPFDVAFCPHNSIRHLATPADLTKHLRAVANVLVPRGVYIVGIGLQPLEAPIAGEDTHAARRGGVQVSAVCQYFETPRHKRRRGPRRERVVTFTTVTSGRGRTRRSRTIESSYDLLCVDPAMWKRCVRLAGLSELAVVDDDRAANLPPERTDYAYRILARSDHRAQ